MRARRTQVLLAEIGGALAAAVAIAGCGNNYRPTVTPVYSSGPAAQVTSYAVVVSSTSSSTAGLATIIDYSGDSVMAQASIGVGPLAFAIDEAGAEGYTYNSDHTISNFPISTSLQTKNVLVTTLPTDAEPLNLYVPSTGMWAGDLDGNVVDTFSGTPQAFEQAIPVAPTPAFIAGSPTGTGERQYVISQNISDPTGVECNQTPSAEPDGTVTPVEVSTLTTDAAITVGRCPVFAVMTPNQRRLFVLNRGSDTISVINGESGTLDDDCPDGCTNQNGQTYYSHPVLPLSTTAVEATGVTPLNGTSGMPTTAGPVYAEYNQATSQLVVADYAGGTISVIDVSLDEYGNDSTTFGTTYTIAVGAYPASVTVLYDGSRAYTANQGDYTAGCSVDDCNGTVTVVNLSSHTVEKTLTVVGLPRTVVSTQNSDYAKIYVASPNSSYVTILEDTPTETDIVDTTVLVAGKVLDVKTTTQSGASQSVSSYSGTITFSNPNYSSRIPGYGQPCNLPPALMTADYGSSYSLDDCQALQ